MAESKAELSSDKTNTNGAQEKTLKKLTTLNPQPQEKTRCKSAYGAKETQ